MEMRPVSPAGDAPGHKAAAFNTSWPREQGRWAGGKARPALGPAPRGRSILGLAGLSGCRLPALHQWTWCTHSLSVSSPSHTCLDGSHTASVSHSPPWRARHEHTGCVYPWRKPRQPVPPRLSVTLSCTFRKCGSVSDAAACLRSLWASLFLPVSQIQTFMCLPLLICKSPDRQARISSHASQWARAPPGLLACLQLQ